MLKIAVFFTAAVMSLYSQPNLMPWPAKFAPGPGSLSIDRNFRIALTGYTEPRLHAAASRLMERISRQTGIRFAAGLGGQASEATLAIHSGRAAEAVQQLGEDESYRLEVSPKQARLTAPNPLGILRGMETFVQLIQTDAQKHGVPTGIIEDKPRFPWRGLHMDVSRHWMPIEAVKRNIEGMAAVKLNVYHWHLSDDQGFRIESKHFPKLQQLGSDGHYYTQDQVRDVIAFARDRGIRIVPEFDIPGHATSWLVGYPDLASAPGPYEIIRTWGVFDPTMDPTRDSVYEFLDAFIGEMATLFPDHYFHIGGDEVNGKQWRNNRQIQAFMRQHELKDNHALQAYFNKRIQAIVAKHGKRMEGWDEILSPDLPKDIVIQSWQGQKSLADAARLGYSGILSSGYYLDHMEPASTLYMVDPLGNESASLSEQEKRLVLGGEVCMWAEYVDPENVDSRIWPRTAAIAERLWSPEDVKDIGSMYRRLDAVSRELDSFGLTHNSGYEIMLKRLAGSNPIEPIKTLADVVTPAALGPRTRTHKYTQQTPLNRLVDAARPESHVAREFAELVDKMDHAQVRRWLTLWRDDKTDLEPAPLLRQLGAVGLQALDHIEKHRRPPAAWVSEQRKLLDEAKRLHAEVHIAIVPSIEKLVDAASKS